MRKWEGEKGPPYKFGMGPPEGLIRPWCQITWSSCPYYQKTQCFHCSSNFYFYFNRSN